MNYSIDHIAAITGGTILQQEDQGPVEQLLIDSRKLIFPQTSLFFALKGPRRNGHTFIGPLYAKGVRHFVVSEPVGSALPGATIIQVPDTLQALQALAAWHRRQFSIPVTGITGSNGKTIVKEWLNQLLEDQYHIIRSPKSYNSQIGVPLSVWPLQATHELGIFEAGISKPGEMEKLQAIIRPTTGIFTNLGEAHSEGFESQEQKLLEKFRLFIGVNLLICRNDDPLVRKGLQWLQGQWQQHPGPHTVFTWGRDAQATLKISDIQKEKEQTRIIAQYSGKPLNVTIPFIDEASIENAIHCWCLLLHLNIDNTVIQQKMLQLSHVAMRLEMKTGINNCSVINDTYSADLSSFNIALDFLSQQSQHAKRTVILSDILQSGKTEEALYTAVAKALQQRRIDRLIGIGETIGRWPAIFEQAGLKELAFYSSVAAFKKDFHQLHFRDETILLKGARVFELEQIDQLLQEKVHQTILEIDLNAVAWNLKQYQQLLKPTTRLMAMVKAFSYGSGSYEIANVLQFHKVDYLAVAYADEGVELRRGGINLPIMVMNADETTFDVLVQYNLEPDIYSPALLDAFAQYLRREGIQQFPVHLELETGMNRLGFSENELPALLEVLRGPLFKVQSVFSHLAASDDPQHDAFTAQQFDRYQKMAAALQNILPYSFLQHISNTAGISRHPALELDMVRLGIGLYGIDSGDTNRLSLQEVSTLISTIAQIKRLQEGETVSYGRKGVLNRNTTIATVRIGYADGYPRNLSNGAGKVWVHGQLAPVIGSVNMDMTMIDITDIPHVQEGDEVVLFGKQLSVKQVALWAQTIPYEILTGISQRVKRVYFEE